MDKQYFEQHRRLLWVYMRSEGKCSICGGEVNPREVATDRQIQASTDIDSLREVRLMHPFCKAAAARRERPKIAA